MCSTFAIFLWNLKLESLRIKIEKIQFNSGYND